MTQSRTGRMLATPNSFSLSLRAPLRLVIHLSGEHDLVFITPHTTESWPALNLVLAGAGDIGLVSLVGHFQANRVANYRRHVA